MAQGKRRTLAEFIEEANIVHNNKYDYSKSKYVNADTKVIIICPIHGDFPQKPSLHLNGANCSKCAHPSIAYSTKEFIEKANIVHNYKYDYSKTEYVNNHDKIIIICPIHGDFPQAPSGHLAGRGCRKCSDERWSKIGRSNTEKFIEKAKKIHGDKYKYPKTVYVTNSINVIITCPEHGDFPQKPANHLLGKGCAKCNGGGLPRNNEDFIKNANKKHDNRYDYSKSEYVGNNTKVIITCPIHGDFPQTPGSHLNGSGCPTCAGRISSPLTYEEWKKIIHPLKLKSMHEYFDWWDKNIEFCRQNGIPRQPDSYYRKNK